MLHTSSTKWEKHFFSRWIKYYLQKNDATVPFSQGTVVW